MSDATGLRAIVLAAGASSRLGEPKALADLGGRTALERLVAAIAEGLGAPPVVVVGRHSEEIAGALLDLAGAALVTAERWRDGRTASLATGLRAIAGADGALPDVLVAPVDVPLVAPATVAGIARAWRDAGSPPRGWLAPRLLPGDAADPREGARYGHPIALGRALAAGVLDLDARAPLRALRATAAPLLSVDVDDVAVVDDLDTGADLARLRARLGRPS